MAVGIRHADQVPSLYPQKLAITSPTSGGRTVGIVRSRTQTMEFSLFLFELKDDIVHSAFDLRNLTLLTFIIGHAIISRSIRGIDLPCYLKRDETKVF
jgi:hypothetical protein